MEGRVIITGATGAVGAAATRALAAQGKFVVMACRNRQKADAVRSAILADIPGADIGIRLLDLTSLASVRAFAEEIGSEPVAALFNNAGVISRGYALTPDGLENTFSVNYFAPFLLTQLLLPRLQPGARIVNMVSLTCCFVSVTERTLRPGPEDFSQLGTYARAKTALLHASLELARRYPEIRVNLADPGIVNSSMIDLGHWFDPLADLLFRPFCKSPEKGAKPALAALEATSGPRYYVGGRSKPVPSRYRDSALDLRLWQETERILGGILDQ